MASQTQVKVAKLRWPFYRRIRPGDKVKLDADILARVKPWEIGRVVADGEVFKHRGAVLVWWEYADDDEYHWLRRDVLQRV